MRRITNVFLLGMALLAPLTFSSCDGRIFLDILLSLYDAPIDDPLYDGVYLTIAGLEVNGESIDDFPGKMTLEVSALQQGITAQLANAKVAPGQYDEITLILDYDSDENGQAPGCYVNTIYDRKIDLANGRSGQEVISIAKALDLKEGETANLIIDFDLRKTVRPSRPGDESEVSLIEGASIGQALRVVRKSETGNLLGQLSLPPGIYNQANSFAIYAYRAGTFNRAEEEQDLDGDGIAFENAVASTFLQVISNEALADFSLYYLEPGDYELVFEAYQTIEFSRIKRGFLQMTEYPGLTVPVTITQQQEVTLTLAGKTIVP